MRLRMHRFLPHTIAEGPGERACLWVQGCPIHCAGCAVPWTWPETGGQEVDVPELARTILNGPRVEGVTFLGGEPFAQAEALAELSRILRGSGLSIMTFTGYTIEKIRRSRRQGWHDLLSVTDLLIDGPYRRDLRDLSRPWVGSSNQRYHFLTPRYRSLAAALSAIPNRLEVRLRADGQIQVNGMILTEDLDVLFSDAVRVAPATVAPDKRNRANRPPSRGDHTEHGEAAKVRM